MSFGPFFLRKTTKESFMAESFGIPQLKEYLVRMGIKIAQTKVEQQVIELAFHGNYGQWRMILGIQQGGEVKKLMLIAPHIGSVTTKKRLECLEALMAVNYRIAIGKFGLDLEDGEVRLEETIPLANNNLTFEQFQLTLGAIMQTVVIYQNLLPRIVQQNFTVQEALKTCEQEFFQSARQNEPAEVETGPLTNEEETFTTFSVDDVLAEVERLLERGQE
jgi:hypothetical protein